MVGFVGILNVTPDSFSDGGQFFDTQKALKQADQLFKDGAELVDVGAESTRPGATALSDDEEWERLEPVLKVLIPRYPGKISLDSYHPKNARQALAIGPVIVNDVTGLNNPEMIDLVIELKPKVIISHLPTNNVQDAHNGNPVSDVNVIRHDLLGKAKNLEAHGIPRKHILLDPGIGFGKTMELNEKLLRFAELVPEYDVMIGYSRKRFLGEKRTDLAPNLAAGEVAIRSGARYIRVHDVAGHRKLL